MQIEPGKAATLFMLAPQTTLTAFDGAPLAPPLSSGSSGRKMPIPAGRHTLALHQEWVGFRTATGEASPPTTAVLELDVEPDHSYRIQYDAGVVALTRVRVRTAPYVLDLGSGRSVSRPVE